jgi:hypothetical protein
MRRYVDGEAGIIPTRLGVHLVAARYGTTPGRVRGWSARDYADAIAMLGATQPFRMGKAK